MKLRLLIILLLSTASMAAAQEFSLSGSVAASSGEHAAYATVSLLQETDSALVGGAITKDDGTFSLKAAAGSYILSVSSVGYENYYQKLRLNADTKLGTISIAANDVALGDVSVVHKRPSVTAKPDRMIFNVADTNEAKTSNSIYDLLSKTPGLIIDKANHSISIVGKGTVNIMVNGRLVNMDGQALTSYLNTISPDLVKNIEVITTPPAKYDAEGNAGLININTKAIAQDYIGGTVNAAYADRDEGRNYSGGYVLNFKKKKWSISKSLSYYNMRLIPDMEINQEQAQTFRYESTRDEQDDYTGLGIGLGVDFAANEKLDIGARYNYSKDVEKEYFTAPQDNYVFSGGSYIAESQSLSESDKDDDTHLHNALLFADYDLDSLGSKLSLEFGAVISHGDGDGTFQALETDTSNNQSESHIKSLLNSDKEIYTTSLSWQKITKLVNFELGGKLTFSTTTDDYMEYRQHSTTEDPNTSTNFKYTENIQAAYIDLSKDIKQWSFRLGLRGENTNTEAHEFRLDSINEQSYFKLFPTVSLAYTDKKENTFAFNYNRRLSRPWMWTLNPSPTYMGTSSVMEGNPFLKPSFGDYISLKYARQKLSFTLGANYQKDMFSSQTSYYRAEDSIFVIGRFNNFKEQSYYANLNLQVDKFSWWSSYNLLSFSYFKNQNTYDAFDLEDNEGYSLYFSTNNTLYPLREEIKEKLSFSVNFWYKPTVDGGREKKHASSNLSLGANWNVVEDKFALSLWASDVLARNRNSFESWENDIHTTAKQYWDVRSVQLSLKYSFGGNIRTKYKAVNEEEMNRL